MREREIAANEEGMKEKIASNLEHLAREKVLISSGQQLIANMTSDIRQQLGESLVSNLNWGLVTERAPIPLQIISVVPK